MDKNDVIIDKICESGLSRIEHWMDLHDIACVSACRSAIKDVTDGTNPEDVQKYKEAEASFTPNNGEDGFNGVPVSSSENKTRCRNLKARLLSLGYGVTDIEGNYIEGFGTPKPTEVIEQSFFVVNLKDDPAFFGNIFELCEYFNQDSALFKPKGQGAFLIGTNGCDFPGYNQKTAPKDFHALAGRFMSRVRNAAFSFANNNNLVIKKDKFDASEKDGDDWDSEFLFRNDVDRPPMRKENIKLSDAMVEAFNRHIDSTILETMESYTTKQRYAIGSVSQLVTEGLRTVRENKSKKENKNMTRLKYPTGLAPLNEFNLGRLKHHARHGMVVLSANRSDIKSSNPRLDLTPEYERYLQGNPAVEDNEETREMWLKKRNKAADESLLADIKAAGYAFSKTFGGYHGQDSVVDSYEPSFVVYNHAPSHSNDYRNFADLKAFAIKMCDKYKQESVYVQEPGTPPPPPKYLTADDSVDMEFSGNFRLNRDDAEFYTTTKRERSNPQRFTAEGVERKLNESTGSHIDRFFEGMFRVSGPSDYSNRMKRVKSGEVFLDK